jgi:hypothetical protein
MYTAAGCLDSTVDATNAAARAPEPQDSIDDSPIIFDTKPLY